MLNWKLQVITMTKLKESTYYGWYENTGQSESNDIPNTYFYITCKRMEYHWTSQVLLSILNSASKIKERSSNVETRRTKEITWNKIITISKITFILTLDRLANHSLLLMLLLSKLSIHLHYLQNNYTK